MVRLTVRGGGSATAALTVSKCENFDPLKGASNSVLGTKNTCFFAHTKKISDNGDTVDFS